MANRKSTSGFSCLTPPPESIGSPSRVRPSPLSPSAVPSDEVLDKFQNVIRLLGELRQRSNQCRRIQRGSPGAGSLSSAIDPVKSQLNLLKSDIEAILTQYATLSCMTRLRGQYNLFDQILNEQINEAGYDHGYSFRVYYLERLNFESGTLKGMMETVLEYWKHADKDMEHPQLHIARVLTFSDEDTILDPFPKLIRDPIYQNGDIKVKVNLSMYMCSQFAKLLNSKEHCDVSFRIGTHCIQAHRIILAAQSEYFEKLLFGGMSEAQNSTTEIFFKDVSISSFELLLQFAYTGCVELDGAQLQGVLQLIETADRFCFVHLKDALAEKLSSFISVTSVLPIFVCANQLELKELRQCCLRYADLHAREVLKQEAVLSLTANTLVTLLSRDSFSVEEMLVYTCIQSWMKRNSVTDCKPLLQCVRLSEIPAEQLLDLAQPYGHFTDREVMSALRVQMKRQFDDMQPRGLCEKGKNLFEFKETAEINGTVSWRRAQVSLSTLPGFPVCNTTQIRPPPSTANTSAVANIERPGLQPPLGSPLLGGQAPNVQLGQPVPLQLLGQQPYQPLRGLRMSGPFYNKPDCPLNQAVLIPSQNSHQASGLFPVVQTPATAFPITVALNNIYLLNNIEFEGFPEDRKDGFRNLKFSYVIEISRDGTSWSMLFDFSSYSCFGRQNLLFPKQAIRFIKFKVSPNLLSPQLTIRLISCKLEDFHSTDFEFRKNNIIAPLHFVKPHFVEETKPFCNTSGCIATDLYFRKPISISSTQFHLEASHWPTGTVGDVVVSWGIEGGTTKEKELQNIMLSSVSSQVIKVDFGCEDIVNMMTISVKNVVIGSNDRGEQNNIILAQKVSIKNLEMSMDQTFIREIECVDNERLHIHQLYIGDVGCVVWDAALVLCRFLSHSKYFPHSYWKGKQVIELGSGTGAVGLTAGVLGANVTITDLPYCIALMQKNIDDNGTALLLRNGKVLAKVLEWGQDVSSFHPIPDVILMADVIYYDEVTDKLVDTVKKLSSHNTYIIMSYEVRTTGNKPEIVAKFFQLMSLYFSNHEVDYNDLEEDCRSKDIKIFIFKLEQ